MVISQIADGLIGSEIIKIASEVSDLQLKGQQVINLTIGDFDPAHYPIPEDLRDQVALAYKRGQTNYPPASGVLGFKESLSQLYDSRFGLSYKASQFVISAGSRPLIYSAFLTLIDKGDKVVYPVPSWNNNHYCYLTGAEQIAVKASASNRYLLTAADLKDKIKGATLLALCSPQNPTGTMFLEKDLMEICDLVLSENESRGPGEKPLYLLYDQIYSLLTYGGHQHVNPVGLRPEMRPYTVFVDGASKGFASTGIRVGWAFGPPVVTDKMRAIVSHMGAWAPTPEQHAMAAFLKETDHVDAFLYGFRFKLQRSLNALYKGIIALKEQGYPVDAIEPMGAIYLTVKLALQGKKSSKGEVLQNAMEVNFYLIEQAGVALVPFSAFGDSPDSPWYRASVGACALADIEKLLPRLKTALDLLL